MRRRYYLLCLAVILGFSSCTSIGKDTKTSKDSATKSTPEPTFYTLLPLNNEYDNKIQLSSYTLTKKGTSVSLTEAVTVKIEGSDFLPNDDVKKRSTDKFAPLILINPADKIISITLNVSNKSVEMVSLFSFVKEAYPFWISNISGEQVNVVNRTAEMSLMGLSQIPGNYEQKISLLFEVPAKYSSKELFLIIDKDSFKSKKRRLEI